MAQTIPATAAVLAIIALTATTGGIVSVWAEACLVHPGLTQ